MELVHGTPRLCVGLSTLVLHVALSYISGAALSFKKVSGKKGDLQM